MSPNPLPPAMRHFPEFNPYFMGLEIISILIIIICAFLIYYKTKNIYTLSEHKGIGYFRKGFLFIGIGHIWLLLNILFRSEILVCPRSLEAIIFTLFNLINLIGIGYLFSSLFFKKIKEFKIYLVTVLVFILGFLFHTKFFVSIYSFILILGLGIVSFLRLRKHSKTKKNNFSQIYIIYILIFLYWLIMSASRSFINLDIFGRILNVMVLALVLLYIAYLVNKKLK